MTEPHVVVHPEHCAGSEACLRVAPDVFALDADGRVELRDARPGTARLDEVIEARDACPLAVIEVLDEHGDPLD
ncbi:ferredoxin [Prauserella endophytica]|uniref:ferredoxin n=1 Tax=Prauserella endophytica TaxID=1592324 RepID=UPI0013050B30|nr:ferredoxin [Prauserella endophytica]